MWKKKEVFTEGLNFIHNFINQFSRVYNLRLKLYLRRADLLKNSRDYLYVEDKLTIPNKESIQNEEKARDRKLKRLESILYREEKIFTLVQNTITTKKIIEEIKHKIPDSAEKYFKNCKFFSKLSDLVTAIENEIMKIKERIETEKRYIQEVQRIIKNKNIQNYQIKENITNLFILLSKKRINELAAITNTGTKVFLLKETIKKYETEIQENLNKDPFMIKTFQTIFQIDKKINKITTIKKEELDIIEQFTRRIDTNNIFKLQLDSNLKAA